MRFFTSLARLSETEQFGFKRKFKDVLNKKTKPESGIIIYTYIHDKCSSRFFLVNRRPQSAMDGSSVAPPLRIDFNETCDNESRINLPVYLRIKPIPEEELSLKVIDETTVETTHGASQRHVILCLANVELLTTMSLTIIVCFSFVDYRRTSEQEGYIHAYLVRVCVSGRSI